MPSRGSWPRLMPGVPGRSSTPTGRASRPPWSNIPGWSRSTPPRRQMHSTPTRSESPGPASATWRRRSWSGAPATPWSPPAPAAPYAPGRRPQTGWGPGRVSSIRTRRAGWPPGSRSPRRDRRDGRPCRRPPPGDYRGRRETMNPTELRYSMTIVKLRLLPWSQATDWPAYADIAVRAEALGYDSLWSGAHLYAIFGDPYQPIFEAYTTPAAWP